MGGGPPLPHPRGLAFVVFSRSDPGAAVHRAAGGDGERGQRRTHQDPAVPGARLPPAGVQVAPGWQSAGRVLRRALLQDLVRGSRRRRRLPLRGAQFGRVHLLGQDHGGRRLHERLQRDGEHGAAGAGGGRGHPVAAAPRVVPSSVGHVAGRRQLAPVRHQVRHDRPGERAHHPRNAGVGYEDVQRTNYEHAAGRGRGEWRNLAGGGGEQRGRGGGDLPEHHRSSGQHHHRQGLQHCPFAVHR